MGLLSGGGGWGGGVGGVGGGGPYTAKGAQQAGYLTDIYSHHYYFGDIISCVSIMKSLYVCNT